MKARTLTILIVFLLILNIGTNAFAAGVSYLPDVTAEMSKPSYWTTDNRVLMTYEEICTHNLNTIKAEGTSMHDLKNHPETVDGISLNEALLRSSRADADYYLGWTYIESSVLATGEDYDALIMNTQNPNPSAEQQVLYGIAVCRTGLRTFPSPKAIWDDPSDVELDYQLLSAVRVNEPLIITSISADGRYYLAKNICCSGWVPVEDVAVCTDKTQWLCAWDIAPERAIVVYGDKVITETSVSGPATSELMLTMGSVLEKADIESPNILVDNRAAYQNYVVWIPVRNSDGSFGQKKTLISEHTKVHEGYMPLTKANIARVAFSALGTTYGWGGGLYSDDCSGYMRNVYKCFGLELARNTLWQTAMPVDKVDMTNMCREDREAVMDALPFGSILYFDGHEMMYLGKENEKHYVISAVGSIMQPENPGIRQRIRSTVINTLDIKRANGKDWLDNLTVALVPYWPEGNTVLPQHTWYHDGVAFVVKNGLMKGDENGYFRPGRDISWAEFLQIIWNMEGNPDVASEDIAYEVEPKWYDSAVSWATANRLIYEEDRDFVPEDRITREELASVMYLYARYKGIDTSVGESTNILSYDDAFSLSGYAVPAVQYAVGARLINGRTESTVNPADYTTRAEASVILERFYALPR